MLIIEELKSAIYSIQTNYNYRISNDVYFSTSNFKPILLGDVILSFIHHQLCGQRQMWQHSITAIYVALTSNCYPLTDSTLPIIITSFNYMHVYREVDVFSES